MDKKSVKLIRIQRQNQEEEKEVIPMEAYSISENEVLYEYLQEGKRTSIRILSLESELMIRVFNDEYHAQIPLRLHQTTQGNYYFGNQTLTFDFILRKIECKGVAISFEYDIVSKESVIFNNTWRIEVT